MERRARAAELVQRVIILISVIISYAARMKYAVEWALPATVMTIAKEMLTVLTISVVNMGQLAPQLSHLDPKMNPTGSLRTLKNQQKPMVFQCFSFSYFFAHLDPLGTLWIPSWSILDAFGTLLGASWGPPGSSLGPLELPLGSSWAILGLS